MLVQIAKFPVPYNTHRRRAAKKGEGNRRYAAATSGTRFHTCLVTAHCANQGPSAEKHPGKLIPQPCKELTMEGQKPQHSSLLTQEKRKEI